MAESPEEILKKVLSNGNALDPNAQLNVEPWLPKYSASPEDQARGETDLEYGSKIRAVDEAARQSDTAYQRNRGIEERYGKEIDPRLESIYKALGSSLKEGRADTKQSYSQAVGNIRNFYEQSMGANQQVNTDLFDRITKSAQQLGLGAAVPDATGKLLENYQFNQGQMAQAGAGRASNLEEVASKIYGLDTNRIGAAAQEGSQQRANAQQQVLATLSDLLFQNQQEQSGYRSEKSGLEQDKATALQNLIRQITDQRSQDQIGARGNALSEMTTRAGLADSNRNFAEQQRQFNTQVAEGRADRAARSSGGGSGNPIADLAKIAGIQNIQSQIADRGGKKLTGQAALDQLLNSPSQYWSKTQSTRAGKKGARFAPKETVMYESAGPKFREAISAIIDSAARNALPQASNQFQKGNEAQLALAAIGSKPGMNQNALRAALNAYYKGLEVPGQTDDLLGSLLASLLGA